MLLNELLPYIDKYQFIIIKHHGDILYRGRREYFITGDVHNNIKVVNILVVPDENEVVPSITICINNYFG